MVSALKRLTRVGAVVNWRNRTATEPRASGARPRYGIPLWEAPPADDDTRKIRAALEQIDACGELHSFAGPRHEKIALVAFARTRRLITWRKTRHELTPAGRKWLIAHGGAVQVSGKKFPSRSIAATLAVIVIAGAWYSADASRPIFSPPARTATVSPVMPHADAKLDPMAARAGTGAADLSPVGHPLAMIRADAPVFAAPRRPGAVADNAPQSAGGEPSRAPDQATKTAAKPGHKASRASRHRSDDRGSALAFVAPDRPLRRAPDFPSWGTWYSDHNGGR
jgi:hypothetical protein